MEPGGKFACKEGHIELQVDRRPIKNGEGSRCVRVSAVGSSAGYREHADASSPRLLGESSYVGEGYERHSSFEASAAPSTSERSFSHATVGWMSWRVRAVAAKPQSAPAMTFARPTMLA
jgi:hypothetical protein